MGEQRLRVLRQSLKRCCTRSSWLAGTDIVLIGCPPSTVEWTADDTNSFSKIHAALPKGHNLCENFDLFDQNQVVDRGGISDNDHPEGGLPEALCPWSFPRNFPA